MYNVFLVDDEIVIREGIRNHALWDTSDFVLAGEAPDGEMALAMLQDIRPDILVTDIRMPFMDGLELVRQAKEGMPWLHVIILSGYDDFSYARQALALGVHDYLLKPVRGTELLDALQKVAVHIEKERRTQADMQALKEQFASNRQYLKEKAIQELFQPGLPEEALAQIHESARKMGVILRANCYTTLLVQPASAANAHEDTARITTQLRRLAGTSGGAYHFCECAGNALILVMGDSGKDLDERAYGLAQAIRHEMLHTSGVEVRISLGKTVGALRELADSFAQAQRISSSTGQSVAGAGKAKAILGIEDLPDQAGLSLAELNVLPIQQQLQYVTSGDIDTVLDRYIESLGDFALHSTMMINYVYVEIMLAASRMVKESGGNPVEVLPQFGEHLLGGMESIQQVKPALRDVLSAAVGYRENATQSKHDVMIRKAQAFLNEHYQDSNIGLKDVAEHVALSNNHFCTVFSQETGKTFTEYLTCLRLDKARELMAHSGLRTSEIAYQVGYSDPHYFSYLFKRHMGMSPREYKKEKGISG